MSGATNDDGVEEWATGIDDDGRECEGDSRLEIGWDGIRELLGGI